MNVRAAASILACMFLGSVAIVPAAAAAAAAAAADASTATADGSQLERGRAAFAHRCGMCHRDGGTGTILLARRLGKEQALLEQRTDLQRDYVRHVVRWGYVNMPRISRVELPDADLDAVIFYLAEAKK